jgi:hypothetical protein
MNGWGEYGGSFALMGHGGLFKGTGSGDYYFFNACKFKKVFAV